jgi:hypothetical protein
MSRKSSPRKPRSGMHPLDLITACQPYPKARADEILLRVHSAYEHLKTGGADDDLFDRLGAAINVGLIRAEEIGGPASEGAGVFVRAVGALIECDAMKTRHGHYGFTGPALGIMAEAIELYEAIVRASTPLQMHRAQEEVIRRVLQGDGEPVSHTAAAE